MRKKNEFFLVIFGAESLRFSAKAAWPRRPRELAGRKTLGIPPSKQASQLYELAFTSHRGRRDEPEVSALSARVTPDAPDAPTRFAQVSSSLVLGPG